MAKTKGGRLVEVRINGRNFDPTNDSDPTIKIGALEVENEITAGRHIHSVVREAMGGFSDLVLSVTDDEYTILANIWDSLTPVSVTITRASGAIYGGQCYPSGTCELSNDGKVTLAMDSGDFMLIS
ncbi:hypothetical protein PVA44_07740 (plasmid) [Entomospira nematocerorum]|uniref:Phage tail protein n=1 Tax=Entomospira nematocerorum TaxID=2719987 RepID=A0A968GDJ3_9SPIO|nr:hypothetical protein [Entomospira nematocera]NIZ47804.1 hypothetical protein [Entomospira nematocera]WDI34737.1 hypothetical protein PVA44_07740 [Entomospira nematocera]